MPRNTPPKPSHRYRVEALAESLNQQAETVTRSSRIFIENAGLDDVNPPEDIDELHDLALDVGLIRANLTQFTRDVWKPGVRVDADDDTTAAYFKGGDDAPDFAPQGGFLANCAVMAEKSQPFVPFGKLTTFQRYSRGTVLVEHLKPEGQQEDPAAPITGFKHIRPETVSARTYANTNILIDPEDTETADEITPRGEAAAWVQYDDQSILGRRLGGFEQRDTVKLSQNDVLRQVLDPDIGGQDPEDGVFGESIVRSIKEDAEEYRETKRDRARAIKTKAYGVWSAQFNTEVTETPGAEPNILTEWTNDEQDEWITNVGGLGPGDIIGHDGSITLDQWEPQVPDLGDTLDHYVDDILAPLPAPKYAIGYEENINQFVSNQQEAVYQSTIQEEREYQARSWTQAFRAVAERHDQLNADGLRVRIEPEEETSPVMSLDDETLERLERFAAAFEKLRGDQPTDMFVDPEVLVTEVLQLPDEAIPSGAEVDADESATELQSMMQAASGQGAEADD